MGVMFYIFSPNFKHKCFIILSNKIYLPDGSLPFRDNPLSMHVYMQCGIQIFIEAFVIQCLMHYPNLWTWKFTLEASEIHTVGTELSRGRISMLSRKLCGKTKQLVKARTSSLIKEISKGVHPLDYNFQASI